MHPEKVGTLPTFAFFIFREPWREMAMKRDGFKFSDDDRKRIQGLLREYDPKNVERFICYAEETVDVARLIRVMRFIVREAKTDRDKLYVNSVKSLRSKFSLLKLAFKANKPSMELIKIMEDAVLKVEKRKSGRPKVNNDGLITLIAYFYNAFIDIPHSYKGPFSETINIVFADDFDRRRGIRDGVKNLKNIKKSMEK